MSSLHRMENILEEVCFSSILTATDSKQIILRNLINNRANSLIANTNYLLNCIIGTFKTIKHILFSKKLWNLRNRHSSHLAISFIHLPNKLLHILYTFNLSFAFKCQECLAFIDCFLNLDKTSSRGFIWTHSASSKNGCIFARFVAEHRYTSCKISHVLISKTTCLSICNNNRYTSGCTFSTKI